MQLTPPGEVFRADFRPKSTPPTTTTAASAPLKLLQWNIERGIKLPGIIEELKRIDADIIGLQEIDVGCERSSSKDTGVEIAKALQLNYVFLSEFEEIKSPLRGEGNQGGGVHGNAILTKFDILDVTVVPHRLHPVDWNNPTHPLAQKEPRRGERAILRATVATPQGSLAVYCAHLEVFCGMLARIAQLSDIFADARSLLSQGIFHQVILGDLNTMAHGIARFSSHYCCDRMRFLSVGSDEAVVWERWVLSYAADAKYLPENDPPSGSTSLAEHEINEVAAAAAAVGGGATSSLAPAVNNVIENDKSELKSLDKKETAVLNDGDDVDTSRSLTSPSSGTQSSSVNPVLLKWGVAREYARDALNPGFACPFPAASTVTLDNPAYRLFSGRWSLMKGKLDWVLMRRLQCVRKAMGNLNFELSDHRWLLAEANFD